MVMGLSPRVRGNRGCLILVDGEERSIPACAGEPAGTITVQNEYRVYPRVCGGTAFGVVNYAAAYGLSPRVRGNPLAF